MDNNSENITFEDAVKISNIDNIILKRRSNDLLISDYQLDVIKRSGIDFNKYSSLRDLLFDIEEILNVDYDEELDLVSSQLAELIYYNDTKK